MIYHSRKPSEPLIKSEPVIFKDTGNDDEGDEAEDEKKKDKEGNGKRNSYYEGVEILSNIKRSYFISYTMLF